jgi:hypothetical protein
MIITFIKIKDVFTVSRNTTIQITYIYNFHSFQMMRNIFLKCFNTYKLPTEPLITDSYALNHMKYSPRLFEIKFSQRSETVAYFDDCDMFVLAEGEAASFLNFHTGKWSNYLILKAFY